MKELETRDGSAGLAGLQPGSSSSVGSSRRLAGLQPGSVIGSDRKLVEPDEDAKLELGEPSGVAGGNGARLEPGEPSELKWSDRGYMPHVDGPQLIQHVSFHLADSLPKEALEVMNAELKSLPPKLRDAEKEKRIARFIDAGKGSCVLRVPKIAEMVQNAFLLFHGERYTLHAWCVMPNHVHVLFQPKAGWTMSKIVASWKSFTGRRISEHKMRAGLEPGEPSGKPNPIWHREYWDRYIRDQAHYANTVKYIHENPVKAGLVKKAEKWKWSSAYITTIE
jgi:REP element-mobilizing transposase RayT